jgi:hypothetical protein
MTVDIPCLAERIAAICVVLRNLVQSSLIFCPTIGRGRRMLLDERITPHHG